MGVYTPSLSDKIFCPPMGIAHMGTSHTQHVARVFEFKAYYGLLRLVNKTYHTHFNI